MDMVDGRLPRSLWPIMGRPVICHVLTWLRDAGVSNVSICANSQTDVIQKHVGRDAAPGLNIDYVEDVAPRGPAGCVRDAGGTSAWDLVVAVEGAVMPRVDLQELLSAHQRSGACRFDRSERRQKYKNHVNNSSDPGDSRKNVYKACY
ncbi:MAG: hypothetical protein IID12_08475 [Candidatus Marinimicrobia bacterium]|nr:hypothetical protein [Candidatus Neomarinimicrobiota bacterium]